MIAAGGTAGHVLSALAVAEVLTQRDVFVTLAGSPDRVEARLVPDAGYELDTFRIEGIPRQPTPALLRSLAHAVTAPAACRAILRRRRPDVVFGAGGFVAGPVVLAAATMRIPAALAEADAHLGLANRLASPFARRLFLAYPLDGRHGSKIRVVGRPIPERARPIAQDEAREIFELPADGPVLLVAGALAGARSINELVVESFADVGPAILHISGERDSTRSAAGRPAILVPYPFATSDHQARNAEFFVRAGGAVMVREMDLEDVPDLARSMLDDPDRLARMGEAMLRVAKPKAAEEIAEGLIELASS